jgi:arylsulfatase A-like enzyme
MYEPEGHSVIVDRTVLVVLLLFIVAALAAVVAVGRRVAPEGSTAQAGLSRSAFGRMSEILTIAIWFGLATGTIHVLLAVVNRYVRNRILMVGPQMFWMTPLAYALIFAAVGGLLAVLAGFWSRARLERRAFAAFAALGVFSLMLPFPQLHKGAVALIAAGVGLQAGRAMASRSEWWLAVMRRSTIRGAIAVLALAAVIEAWPMAAERYALARLPAAPNKAPNVLLIVLDTVRAQSLSLYGYERPTTPGLERLAREGATFDFAMSTAPWTLKSHGTIFTGLYPEQIQGDFQRPLDFETPVLAEEFRRRGYVTGGFAGNLIYASRESGLARGFVHYEDYQLSARQLIFHSWIAQIPLVRSLASSRSAGDVWNAVSHAQLTFDSNDFNRKTYERRPAASIADAFLKWQGAQKDRPFFAFLNLFDAHFAYRSPREFERRFALADNEMNGLYDGAIAYVDAEIERLLNELRRRKLLDNTIVVITSDHGEQFGDHGLILHANSLYSQLLHVPLLIRYPPAVPAGLRIDAGVTLRDLPATIAQLAGLSGIQFPGTSLADRWKQGTGTPAPSGSALLAELSNVVRPEPASPASFGPMRSVFDQQFHYIRRGDGAEELFDYRADSGEMTELGRTPAGKAVIEGLRRLLESSAARPPSRP